MTGSINYMITNISLLQPVAQGFMEKTAVNNATKIVTRRLNVTDLQESVMEDVNQDGQGSHVMMVRTLYHTYKTIIIIHIL